MPPETADAAGRRDSRDAGARAAGKSEPRRAPTLWSGILEEWICTLNIERFRDQLAHTTDASQRTILTTLLDEQIARLERSQRSGPL